MTCFALISLSNLLIIKMLLCQFSYSMR